MEYEIIQPPVSLSFREISRKEARVYYQWFMEQIPVRIAILERAVQSTPRYEDWVADYTPDSLGGLGHWFSENVETRVRTEAEKEEIYARAPAWFRTVEIQDWDLTNRTFSLAIDIGMYLARVLEQNVPGLEWRMVEKPRNNANYQQPVLEGTGIVGLNPVRISVVLARSFADASKGPDRLRELYDIWAELLTREPKT